MVATNSLGTTEGADMTFQTNPAIGGLKALPASDISQQSITLNGEFTGNGEMYGLERDRAETSQQ